MRAERAHEGREAMQRIVRDLSSRLPLDAHPDRSRRCMTARTAFVGRSSSQFDRIDFTAFAHRRTERDSHESDQAEVGYFVVPRPGRRRTRWTSSGASRRRSTIDPLKGGIVNVVAEDVEEFDLRYLDPHDRPVGRDLGLDAGDRAAQPPAARGRDHARAQGRRRRPPRTAYTTKIFLPIQQPLSFGIPRMSAAAPDPRADPRARAARRASASAASRSSWCSAPSRS